MDSETKQTTEAPASGRDLDIRILCEVFGVPRRKVFYHEPACDPEWPMFIPSGKSRRTHEIDARPVPHFSTQIAAAWLIVERFTADPAMRFCLTLVSRSVSDDEPPQWYGEFSGPDAAVSRWAQTAPEAICFAALAWINGSADASAAPSN